MENLTIICLLLVSIAFGSIGQILLKKGMNEYGKIEFNEIFSMRTIKMFFYPLVTAGIFLYVLSMTVWLIVLSQAQLSWAYPFAALGYGIVMVLSYFFLGEQISAMRIISVAIIITGVVLLAKS